MRTADSAASLRRYRTLFESMDEGFCILEVLFEAGRATDYRFLEVNAVWEQQTGLRDAVGATIRSLLPEVEQRWIDRYGEVARTGEPLRCEDHVEALDRWFEVYACRVGDPGEHQVAVLFRDTTGRHRAEQALRESEGHYRTVFENMAEGFFLAEIVHDEAGEPMDYRFLDVNAAFATLTGVPRDEASARTAREAFPGLEDYWVQTFARVALTGEPVRLEQWASPLKRWFSVLAYSLRPGIFACLFQDVTERRRADDELRAANARLAEEDRRKNDFLGVLSHELRNPLSPIKNGLYVLARTAPGSAQARRALEVIDRQVGQLSRLVDDLLDVTRITRNKIQLQRERLELNELVERTVHDHLVTLERAGLLLRFVSSGGPLVVMVDRNRIAQVLGNLLDNATKFTPRGGHVTVRVSTEDGSAVLQVEDTGAGLAPGMAARVFEPFMQADRTLDRSRGGLGLGLSLVRGIAELHGGDASASSAGLGTGSVFTVRLPLSAGDPIAPAPEEHRAGGTRRRVLLIEDNLDVANSLREVLELQGHEVAMAHDGQAGLAAVRALRPEIVLCDLGLPGLDGYGVARAIRADQALRSVPLVALSGYALPEDVERAAAAGFDWHVTKPPSLERLEELLAHPPRTGMG